MLYRDVIELLDFAKISHPHERGVLKVLVLTAFVLLGPPTTICHAQGSHGEDCWARFAHQLLLPDRIARLQLKNSHYFGHLCKHLWNERIPQLVSIDLNKFLIMDSQLLITKLTSSLNIWLIKHWVD